MAEWIVFYLTNVREAEEASEEDHDFLKNCCPGYETDPIFFVRFVFSL